ncbi:MAG: hypothetical protein E4G91_09880 [Candidatus Zixiibacteriota bacterium]|nr:MAG: hypothetical protein E4G91_09880 [candidate division Zixibacteria bacterium]
MANEEHEKVVPFDSWRVWDAFTTNLPATPATDDLGLVGGTFATNSQSIQTVDAGGTSTTAYARASIEVPQDYVAGQNFKIRFHAGCHTTVADATATLDLSVYKSDEERGISADLAAAAVANNIKSVTYADVDFVITATSLNPGDILDVRISMNIVDSGDLGVDISGVIGAIKLVYDGR